MIRELFPDEVVLVDSAGESSPANVGDCLYPEEAALISGAGAKRRLEFGLGRFCAHKALEKLGIDGFPVLADENRMPIWPEGIIGSLSHADELCVVAVARRGKLLGIGLDVEEDGKLDPRVIERICGASERSKLEGLDPHLHGNWGRLAFSAKESVYKCYYALTGRKLGFRDVELEVAPESCTFTARVVRGTDHIQTRHRLGGRYTFCDRHVFTGVTITAAEMGSG